MKIEIARKEDYRGYTIVVKRFHEDGFYPFLIDTSVNNIWHCGYAVLPEDHPYYGADYDDVEDDIDVHGGLTFSCELEDIDGYLLNFDCNHYGDNPEVQNEEYTLSECKKLVDQLINIEELSKTEKS